MKNENRSEKLELKDLDREQNESQNQAGQSGASTSQNKQPGYRDEQIIGRGLYKKVRISVRTLDILIGIGVIAIVLVLLFGIRHGGYTVSFNSKGGSDVESIAAEYGELVELPDGPVREGYIFNGWYLDENCQVPAMDPVEIEGSTTLYAGWKEADSKR